MKTKVLVIGLDGACPDWVFDRWREDLPHLNRLMARGTWARLDSTIPPITVPAWTCMLTGKDPGQLGIYGFRNRLDYSYGRMGIANALAVKEDRVWDILSRMGFKVVVVGVPQTYPPQPVNGQMISCFLTPSIKNQYTYPPDLRHEIESWVGEYILDIEHFRTEDKPALLEAIYTMTRKRFQVVRHLISEKPWDFFMMVEMGTDRIHHGFWKYTDPSHPQYRPGNPLENSMRDYYRYIDQEVGELLTQVGEETRILVVSDHGAKALQGGICLNQWLIREGYLVLKEKPEGIVPLGQCQVDWTRTRAWGEGGYYGRIFINRQGREAQGIVPANDYDALCRELTAGLKAIRDDQEKELSTQVFKPEEIYKSVTGIPSDLIVYFGDLAWRSVGTIGYETVITQNNDTGPDDANHSREGIFILYDPLSPGRGEVNNLQITDIAPLLLSFFGLPGPDGLQARGI